MVVNEKLIGDCSCLILSYLHAISDQAVVAATTLDMKGAKQYDTSTVNPFVTNEYPILPRDEL